MFYIVLGGIIGFAVGNLAGALFAPRQGASPIDAIRRRLEPAPMPTAPPKVPNNPFATAMRMPGKTKPGAAA